MAVWRGSARRNSPSRIPRSSSWPKARLRAVAASFTGRVYGVFAAMVALLGLVGWLGLAGMADTNAALSTVYLDRTVCLDQISEVMRLTQTNQLHRSLNLRYFITHKGISTSEFRFSFLVYYFYL